MKLLPPAPGASLAKISNPSTSYSSPLSDGLLKVKTKVISINEVFKNKKKTKEKEEKAKIKKQEKEERSLKEDKLEKPAKETDLKKKTKSVPGSSFLDRIKNFIGKIILGYFAIRLLDHAPKLLGFVKVAAQATEFIIDFGGKILDGLVTFLDFGYKMYDGLKGKVKNLFGESGLKEFENFAGSFKKVINYTLISAMAFAGFGEMAAKAQNALVKKVARPVAAAAVKGIARFVGKGAARAVLQGIKLAAPVFKKIPIIGPLINFAISYFILKEPLGKAAFRTIGSALFGALGAVIGGPFAIFTGLAGQAVGDWAGGKLYDGLFGKPTTDKEPVAPSGTSSGTDDYDDSAAVVAKGSTTGRMISGYPITSPYGYRTHPVTGERGKLHGGIDIGTPTGTAVSLAEDGTIVAAGNFGGYGYMIDAWLPKTGIQLRLAHLSQIIKSSGNFKANQILGKTGGAAGAPGSGSSTGPHLHFEADRQKGAGRYGGSGDPSSFANLLRLGSTQSVSSGQGGAISSYASYDDMFMPEMILIPQIINRNVMPEGRRSESKLMATVLSGGSSSPADVLYKGA